MADKSKLKSNRAGQLMTEIQATRAAIENDAYAFRESTSALRASTAELSTDTRRLVSDPVGAVSEFIDPREIIRHRPFPSIFIMLGLGIAAGIALRGTKSNTPGGISATPDANAAPSLLGKLPVHSKFSEVRDSLMKEVTLTAESFISGFFERLRNRAGFRNATTGSASTGPSRNMHTNGKYTSNGDPTRPFEH